MSNIIKRTYDHFLYEPTMSYDLKWIEGDRNIVSRSLYDGSLIFAEYYIFIMRWANIE